MKPEIHTLPVISTAHLDQQTADILTSRGNSNGWCPCASWEHGFFLFLDELEANERPAPQCLVDIRDWRRRQYNAGYIGDNGWVRLDGDAPVVELPTYEW